MSGKPKPGTGYTEAERAEILEYYRTHGGRPTARHFGISTSTLYGWRRKAGVETEVAGKEATEAALATVKLKRKQLQAKMLDRAGELLDAMVLEECATGRSPKELWQLATSFKVLLESLRLEGGEATERTEVITPDAVEAEIARLEAQFAASE
jgi:transposase-like protein